MNLEIWVKVLWQGLSIMFMFFSVDGCREVHAQDEPYSEGREIPGVTGIAREHASKTSIEQTQRKWDPTRQAPQAREKNERRQDYFLDNSRLP